jgi:hypothetical protein
MRQKEKLWNQNFGYTVLTDYDKYLKMPLPLFILDAVNDINEINIASGEFRISYNNCFKEQRNNVFFFDLEDNLYTNEKKSYHKLHVTNYNNYGLYLR